jgi:hypothetical protein
MMQTVKAAFISAAVLVVFCTSVRYVYAKQEHDRVESVRLIKLWERRVQWSRIWVAYCATADGETSHYCDRVDCVGPTGNRTCVYRFGKELMDSETMPPEFEQVRS